MKTRILLLLALFFLFNSCIVHSLFPFYTSESLYFEKKFIGTWEGSDQGKWDVLLFQEVLLRENKKDQPSELDEDQLRIYNKYKNGYVVYFEKDSTKSSFLAMPFRINDQLFLDFTPIEDKESEKLGNDMYRMHLIETHSLAKFDVISEKEINLKWFSSDKLKELLDEDKIKIKHEKVGFGETVLLTASSEELQQFIKKYLDSKDASKWETDVEVNLKTMHEK